METGQKTMQTGEHKVSTGNPLRAPRKAKSIPFEIVRKMHLLKWVHGLNYRQLHERFGYSASYIRVVLERHQVKEMEAF